MALSEKELEVQKEYLDTLNTLNCNSKPLIDVLTEVAEENKEFARVIVKCIEEQLERVSMDLKLPILYLIDSIMKNEQAEPIYKQLFCYRLHLLFAKVFKEGKDDVRSRLSKLRFTWNGILPPYVLQAIDNEVRKIYPPWGLAPAVHVNPKFIPQGSTAAPFVINSMKTENASKSNPPKLTKKEIMQKKKELLALQERTEQLERERLKSQKLSIRDERSERLAAVANQVFSDVEKLKNGVHNPIEVQKVRETAINMKNSLIKSLSQNPEDLYPSTHVVLNDLIQKLDETIKLLSDMEKNPIKRKVIVDKNHFQVVPIVPVTMAANSATTKAPAPPRAWLSRNTSTSPYVYTKPALNGTPVAPQNPPAFRIAPVSAQLINAAARRPRDPRLRKIEEQEAKAPTLDTVATAVAKEIKLPSAPVSFETKNDKQNVLLTDVSKTKDFVSETPVTAAATVVASTTTTITTTTTDVVIAVTRNAKPTKTSDVVAGRDKCVTAVERDADRRPPEINAQPAKPSKQSNNHHVVVAAKKRDASPSMGDVPAAPKIKDFIAPSKFESSTPSSSLSSSSSSTKSSSTKNDLTQRQRAETKASNKIKVKVENVAKKRANKRNSNPSNSKGGNSNGNAGTSSGSHETNGANSVVPRTREERQQKLSALADMLSKVEETKRKKVIQDLSKQSPKMAQKLEMLIKKRTQTVTTTIPTPPPPRIRKESPIVVDDLMDITEDKNDLIIVSNSKTSKEVIEAAKKTATSTTVATTATKKKRSELDQPVAFDETVNKMVEKNETECLVEPVPMDISADDSEKEIKTPSVDAKSSPPSQVEEKSETSATKTSTLSMNLSEQLEAVMNATSSASEMTTVTHSQDMDIRSLLPSGLSLSIGHSLPVVSDMLPCSLPVTAADSAAPPFANPFGLPQPTKDVDYRQLFRPFPLRAIPAAEPVDDDSKKPIVAELEPPPSPPLHRIEVDHAAEPLLTAPSTAVAATDKAATKRKPDDEPQPVAEGAKRRRTMSGSSSDGGESTSRKRFSPEKAVANALPSARSDSDDEDDDEYDDETGGGVGVAGAANSKAGGAFKVGDKRKREQSSYSQSAVLNEDELPTMEPRAASKSPPMFPMLAPNNAGFTTPNFSMFMATTPEIPEANSDVLKMIRRDPVKHIHIDNISREIRHYGSTAVVFLNWDEPRQISFYNGMRKIIIDNDIEIPCYLNAPDVECKVYGEYHRFRLGAPTRELYVDGIGYECHFNGSSKKIRIGGKYRYVRLVGDPPRVHIGQTKRQDLVAGKIDIIVNEEHTIPVFLDAKPQAITVNGIPFVIMFIDALKRVLINDVPFRTAFGGLSQSFKFKNKVYYFRFDILPAGIVPGAVHIFQMIMTKLPSPPPLPPSLQYSAMNAGSDDFPPLPAPPPVPNIPLSVVTSEQPSIVPENSVTELNPPPMNNLLDSVNIDELFQKLVASGIVPSVASQTPSGKSVVDEPKKSPVEDLTIKVVDITKPETLKQKQPGLVAQLYSGIQCGSCGLRFPQEQTMKYSQHLDWHFRLNRRDKNGARTIHSRKWYYNSSDWMIFQEMEDNADRGTSWFESQAATEYTEEVEKEVPCVSAGENAQDAFCELCRDKFEQFYNEEIEEWQIRNATRVDGTLYHPTCYQDHMEKLNNQPDVEEIVDVDEPIPVDDASPTEESTIILEDATVIESDSPIPETNNIDESAADLSQIVTISDDSIVIKQEKSDVSKPAQSKPDEGYDESTEEINQTNDTSEDKGNETDEDSDIEEVQLIEQPVEEIIIQDDPNDLEEPHLETLNVEEIIAVQEDADLPADSDEAETVETPDKIVDITHVPNVASIDGNIELGDSLQMVNTATKIKINITKTHSEEKAPSPKPNDVKLPEDGKEEPPKELNEIAPQPLPPGEEPVIIERKPRLKERKLTEYPPVNKGTEVSGLCSIM